MTRPLRLLVVATESPGRPTAGYSIRNHHLVKSLAAQHEVWVLTYRSHADAIASPAELGATVRAVLAPPSPRKRLAQLASVATTRSHLGGIFHSRPMQNAIDSLFTEVGFDVVLVEGSLLMRFDYGSVPVVLDEHNVEHLLLERTYLAARSPLRKAFAFVEHRKFRREERAACGRAAWCTFTSDIERDRMRRDVDLRGSTVVPNGVDLQYFVPARLSLQSRNIVFTGRMDYSPNADAVLHLVHDILPLIRHVQPDVSVTVVGRDAPRQVRRIAREGVVVTGAVPDVRPYIRDAAVVVAPIRFGAGTRLKVLEALAMGKPLVCTSVGCEGIQVIPEEHLIVADAPAEFAAAVVRLLQSPDQAAALGRRGRDLAERCYGWERCGAVMVSVIEQVASGWSNQHEPSLEVCAELATQ